jgi:hypothetical protein
MDLMKNLGFRCADETNLHIALIAVRTSWIVIVVSLLIWSFFDIIRAGKLTSPFILLNIGLAIYFITILYLRKKIGSGYKE